MYAGATYTDRDPPGLLHPQVDLVTATNPTVATQVGFRYVMGEREGWGHNDHDIDHFAGIGTHAHEIGHLLGLVHPGGRWIGTNPHPEPDIATTNRRGGNILGWGLMTGGGDQGPALVDNSSPSAVYTMPYRSCPNPMNAFYRRDLGWVPIQNLTATQKDVRIDSGRVYRIDLPGGLEYMLEHRDSQRFEGFVSFHRFPSPPGLLVWRHSFGQERPILIVADNRRIRDARERADSPSIVEYKDMLTDPFPASDSVTTQTINSVFSHTAAQGLRQTTLDSPDETGNDANPDPGDAHLALRNIRSNDDHSLVDVYFNYWSGPISGNETWAGTMYVGGDITVQTGATLTIQPNTEIRILANSDDQSGGVHSTMSELIVNGTLNATAGNIIFRSSNTTNPSNSDWYGIRCEPGATVNIQNATIQDALYGIRVDNSAALFVRDNYIFNCGVFALGIYNTNSSNGIWGNNIYQSYDGVYLNNSNIVFNNNQVYQNGDDGMQIYNSPSLISLTTIDGNMGDGIFIESGGTVTITNTSITNSGDKGIYNYSFIGALVNISYSNVFGSNRNYYGLVDQAGINGNISTEPYYYDRTNGDFRLYPYSQLVDAGNPIDAHGNEPLGEPARVDIGRYGNTAQATTTPTNEILNGDFTDTIGRPWDHIFFTAIYGQTWDRVNGAHQGKNGTYYISTCDFVQSGGGGGCHNSPWESETHTGTMRSNRFKITEDNLKFRLAGFNGSSCTGDNNIIRLRRASNDEVLRTETPCGNALTEKTWNVQDLKNENAWVYLELVDGDSGGGYAWIAADYFRQEGSGSGGGGIVNGNFENGLTGWTTTGPWAINNTWPLNTQNPQIGLEGNNCAGTHSPEDGTGTLTSNSFTVTQNYLNLRVGGWHKYEGRPGFNEVRLEMAGGGSSLCSSNPTNTNNLIQKTWDVSNLMNQDVRIVAQDNHNQGGYAWMSVDFFELSGTPSATPATVCGGGGGGGGELTNGDFEQGLAYWTLISGTTNGWEAKNFNKPNKHGTWYATTCDDIWNDGDGGCRNGTSETHTGTLRSDTFTITGSTVSFRLAGYTSSDCSRQMNYARLVRTSDGHELARTSVPCQNPLQNKSWTGLPVGTDAYVELVDNDYNWGWAWIAADYFQMGAGKPATMEPLPLTFRLIPNYPNPFNPMTVVGYELPYNEKVLLEIYDLLGQKVQTLVNEEQSAGSHQIVWNGRNNKGEKVSSGTYIYRLVTPDNTQTRKMTLLR